MAKKHSQVSYKIKGRAESKRKKKRLKSRKIPQQKQQKVKIEKYEKGLSDICSNLMKLDFHPEHDKSLNSTSIFLKENGLSSTEVPCHSSTESKKRRKRASKKRTQKLFSMAKLLTSLPELDQTPPTTNTDTSIPITFTKASNFHYNQKDAKKFYKKIMRKERSSSQKSKSQSY